MSCVLNNFLAVWCEDQRHAASIVERYAELKIDTVDRSGNGWWMGWQTVRKHPQLLSANACDGLLVGEWDFRQRPPDWRAVSARLAAKDSGIARYEGDFSLAKLSDDGQFVALNSIASRVPIFWWRGQGFTIVATLLEWVAALLPQPPVVDRLPLMLWGTGNPEFLSGRTVIEGVRALNRAEITAVGDQVYTRDLGMDFIATDAGGPAGVAEVPGCLREEVMATMRQPEGQQMPDLLTLSGGQDSSLLALIECSMRNRFETFSLLPAFEPARTAELSRISSLFGGGRGGPSRRHAIALNDSMQAINLRRGLPPRIFPVIHPALCLSLIHISEPTRPY